MFIRHFSVFISLLFSMSLPAFGNGIADAISKAQRKAACESMASTTLCSQQKKNQSVEFIENLKLSCAARQKADGCDSLRSEITKNSSVKEASEKILNCDSKAVCKTETDWNSLGSKCWAGIVRFGKDATEKFMKAGDAIVASATENAKCDRNEGGRKQKLYEDYNKTVPEILKIAPPPGPWVESATCGEILRKIRGMNQNIVSVYDRKMIAFEQQNPLARTDLSKYQDPKLLAYKNWLTENGEKSAEAMRATIQGFQQAFSAVPGILKSLQIKLECYNEETKAEIVCNTATAALAMAVTGGLGAVGTKAVLLLVKSSGSLKVAEALVAVEKLGKTEKKLAKATEGSADAVKLAAKAEAERTKVHKIMSTMRGEKGDLERQKLTRALKLVEGKTPEQQDRILKAVVDAHNICADSGFKEYSPDCLRKKAVILKRSGLNQEERELVMRLGIAGKFADVPVEAVTSIRQSSVFLFKRDLTPSQIEAIWDTAGVGSREEKARKLAQAGFSPEEIEKINSGEFRQAAAKAKGVVLGDLPQPSAAAPSAPAPALKTLSPQQKLADQFETHSSNTQAAFDESRKAHLEEMKKNPELYQTSPNKVIEATTSGLKPSESADLVESYLKKTGHADAEFPKVVASIDQKIASEASKRSMQAGFNQYKLQELKVELLNRHYAEKYKTKWGDLDLDRFMDEDEKGFDALKKLEQSVETFKKQGEKLKWPK
jgi:hypothetical protein